MQLGEEVEKKIVAHSLELAPTGTLTRERAFVDELGQPVERIFAHFGELVDVERAELQLGRLEARPV